MRCSRPADRMRQATPIRERAWGGFFAPKDTPTTHASMAKSVKEILSEPAVASQLRETQQMTLLLADGKEFSTFFAKQVSIWGQVVRENNIKA